MRGDTEGVSVSEGKEEERALAGQEFGLGKTAFKDWRDLYIIKC